MKYVKSRNPDGRPSQWRSGPTKTIRVPEAIADDVLRYAQELDKKGIEVLTQNLKRRKSTGFGEKKLSC